MYSRKISDLRTYTYSINNIHLTKFIEERNDGARTQKRALVRVMNNTEFTCIQDTLSSRATRGLPAFGQSAHAIKGI